MNMQQSGGTAVKLFKSELSENYKFANYNYEFYKDVNAFYKL